MSNGLAPRLSAGARIVVLGLLLALIMACTDDAVAEPPDAIDLSDVYPFTLEDCRGALALVADRGSCDPINLVFPRRSVPAIRDALVTAGWTTAGFGSVQSVFLETEQ